MKKLAIALAGALFLAASAPAFACPGHSEDKTDVAAPKTAEKDKTQDKAKAKPAEKDKAKNDTAKKKEGQKKPDKVSMK